MRVRKNDTGHSMVDGLVQTTVEAHSAAAICVK